MGVGALNFLAKADPRTFRFDASLNYDGVPSADVSLHSSMANWLYVNTYKPNFITATKGYLAVLAANNPEVADPNGLSYVYADTDSVKRGGDAWYGVNPYLAGSSVARPVVLNRPFRNVGELGCVFRDMRIRVWIFLRAERGCGPAGSVFRER